MVTKKIVQITYPDGTTTTEEQVVPSEEFVAPPVQSVGGEDMTTLSSNSAAAKDKSNKESSNSNSSNKKKYIIIGGTAGVLLLGLIIGLAVGLSGNDRDRSNADGIVVEGLGNTAGGGGGGGSGGGGSDGGSGGNNGGSIGGGSESESEDDIRPPPCNGEIVRYQMNEIFFSPFPSSTLLHLPLLEESVCIDACLAAGSTSGYFSHTNVGEACHCFDSSLFDCLARWGESYDADSYYSDIASGTLFTSECFGICDYEFCDYDSNYAGCFTGHQYDLQDYMFWGPDEIAVEAASVDAYSTSDCLDFCAGYYAAFHSTDVSADFCRCYEESEISCMMPWGDEVDPSAHVADGKLFTKEGMYECAGEYCDEHPDHFFCYSGSKMSREDYNLYGGEEVASGEDMSERECLQYCSESVADAVYYNSYYDTCYCYNGVSCLAPTGSDAVDVDFYGIKYGSIYVKDLSTSICNSDWCDLDVNNPYCLTGSKVSRAEYNPYGANMVETLSGTDMTEWECLTMCSESQAAYYNTWYDSCLCYDTVDCIAPTGDAVSDDFYDIKFGYLYYKDPSSMATCGADWCDLDDNNPFCLSGSKVMRSEYNLYGTNMVETLTATDMWEWECLTMCSASQAAYLSCDYTCSCYHAVECLAPTGDAVDTNMCDFKYGHIYVKDPDMAICSVDWCDLDDNNPYCFTGSKFVRSEYNLYGANMVETLSDTDMWEWDCLTLCSASEAALLTYDYDCFCYDSVECLAPTGDAVDPDLYEMKYGNIYVKDPDMATCSADWCDLDDNNPFCLSGSKYSRSEYNLYGPTMVETLSGTDMWELDCLMLCRESEAAYYNDWYWSCSCYDNVECLAPTEEHGDTDVYDIEYGYIYLKNPVTCSGNWCDAIDTSAWCL